MADIGLSSFQLDDSGRGISFQKKEPLDMRFDQTSKEPDARFILNNLSLRDLTEIFRKYGEEKYANQIARKVIGRRAEGLVMENIPLTSLSNYRKCFAKTC